MIEDYDKFVYSCRNGTFFHTLAFLRYHGEKYKNVLTVHKEKAAIIGCIVDDTFISHPGASYGGFVITDDCTYKDVHKLLLEVVCNARMAKLKGVKMRLPPKIFHRSPCDDVDFALFNLDFKVKNELTSTVDLTRDLRFADDTRRSVNKASSFDLSVFTSLTPGFYKGLCLNLERHLTRPTHSFEDLQYFEDNCPDRVHFYTVMLGPKMIAGSMVIVCNSEAVHTFYLWQDYEYQEIRPMNYLVSYLIEVYRQMAFRYLNLGISTEDEGKFLNAGLLRFKEGFGGRGVLRKTYSLDL